MKTTTLVNSALIGCLLALTSACQVNSRLPTVETHGALRSIFHEDRTGEVVNLASLLPSPHLYAVGALTDLDGEVTIAAGQVYLSRPDPSGHVHTVTGRSSEAGATLLVAARVERWQEIRVPHDVPFTDLDDTIETLAARAGLDTSQPFPFLVRGVVKDLRWHVIDGARLPDGGGSHEDHLQAAIVDTAREATVVLVGFFSTGHQGVFTHMDSRTHVHCVIEEIPVTGHVDHVVLPAGTALFLPDVNRSGTG